MGKSRDLRIGLSDDIASLRRDHHALGNLALVRILHRLEKTAWDTRGSLDTGFVVKLAIAVRRTVLNPMPWKNMRQHRNDRVMTTHLSGHNGNKHTMVAKDDREHGTGDQKACHRDRKMFLEDYYIFEQHCFDQRAKQKSCYETSFYYTKQKNRVNEIPTETSFPGFPPSWPSGPGTWLPLQQLRLPL